MSTQSETGLCFFFVKSIVWIFFSSALIVLQGTDAIYNPYDQFQSGRRTGIHLQPSRFKVWISVIKFDLAPRFGIVDEMPGGHGPGMSNLGILSGAGKASGRKEIPEECDGMLRIWDGPLREPPICKDLNW